MAKITKNPMPSNDDYIHQYGGGIPQYGTKGSPSLSQQNAEEFQRHMQAQQVQNVSMPKVSPHDLVHQMNSVQNPHLVEPMQKPAPENFGPPKITPSDADNHSNFGPPNSQGFKKQVSDFGPPKPVQEAEQKTQNQLSASQSKTEQATHPQTPTSSSPPSLNSSQSSSSSSSDSLDAKQKKASYKSVEKMEIDNMLQNAMSHMKLKDPDPEAWN